MPNFIDLLPEMLIGALIAFLLTEHIIDRFRSPFRVTFYFKTMKTTCNLSNIETKNNGRTVTWESPSGWPQTMGNVSPEDLVAIKVRNRRRSFCL